LNPAEVTKKEEVNASSFFLTGLMTDLLSLLILFTPH